MVTVAGSGEGTDGGPMGHELQFLLLPRFSSLGLALLTEPLFLLNWLAGERRYSWRLFGTEPGHALASDGTAHAVAGGLGSVQSDRSLFVLASFEAKAHCTAPDVARALRRGALLAALVAGIETGSVALAHAGLLAGRRAAVHWDAASPLQEQYPEVEVVNTAFEMTGRVATSAGALANLDLMLHLIALSDGAALADQVARHLLHHHPDAARNRRASEPLPRESVVGVRVGRAVRIMEQTLEDPLPLPELAARLDVSQRQLERDFRAVYGLSPNRFYRQLRLNLAHRLLQQTDLSVTEVAVSSGFVSSEHFSRAYRAQFGVPPSRDRLQSTQAPASWMPHGTALQTLKPGR